MNFKALLASVVFIVVVMVLWVLASWVLIIIIPAFFIFGMIFMFFKKIFD